MLLLSYLKRNEPEMLHTTTIEFLLKREGNILGATQNECMQFIRFNTNLYDTGWLNSCLRGRTLHALCNESDYYWKSAGLILGLRPANVTTSLSGWALA